MGVVCGPSLLGSERVSVINARINAANPHATSMAKVNIRLAIRLVTQGFGTRFTIPRDAVRALRAQARPPETRPFFITMR